MVIIQWAILVYQKEDSFTVGVRSQYFFKGIGYQSDTFVGSTPFPLNLCCGKSVGVNSINSTINPLD